MTLAKPGRYAVYAALIFAYILLRLWNLTGSCLWFDEIFSIHAASLSWTAMLDLVAQDLIHPPFFYLLLKLWISIGGEGLLWLRLFPVVFSIAALIPFLLLCRELKLKFAPVVFALLLFAVNGSLIKYAQEVRMYAPLLCFSLFSIWLFCRLINSGKGVIFLTLVNVVMVYTHYFGWLVIASELAAAMLIKRSELKKLVLSAIAVLLAFGPWIVAIFRASPAGEKFVQNIGWMQVPGPITLYQFILNLFEPIYFKASSADFASNYLISIPLLLMLAFAGFMYFTNKEGDSGKPVFYLLASFIAVPVIIAFIASWILPVSVWGTRHLIIVFAPFILSAAYILGGVVSSAYRNAFIGMLAVLSVVAIGIQAFSRQPVYIWCGWEVLAKETTGFEKEDPAIVYTFEDLSAYHMWFALRGNKGNLAVEKMTGLENIKEDKAYFLPRGFDEVKKVDVNEIRDDQFWIAFRARKWEIAESPLYDLLSRGYALGDPVVFDAGPEKAILVKVNRSNSTVSP